jgi:hypothetical protein
MVLIVAAFAAYKLSFPTYAYRYRLELALSVDEKIYTGSSVIEVVWRCGPKIADLGRCAASLRGEAAVVAALVNGEDYGPAQDGAVNAMWLCAQAFGNPSTDEELAKLPKLHGRRDLAAPNLPRLLWFSNLEDPRTGAKLSAGKMPGAFGASAGLVRASVEITNDPIVININRKFPWFQAWSDNYRTRGPIYLPNGTALSRYMFVGDASL